MSVSIKNFYSSDSANIVNLWYKNESFYVQRGNGSLFQISKDNTAKDLQGISPKHIEKAQKIGYFAIVESSGFSGNYSIKHTYRLLGGGNGSSHESNSNNDSPSDNSSSNTNDYACAHNNRPGVSACDVAEHLGNLNFGSAGRDLADLLSGHESFSGLNQASSSESGSSSSNSSSESSENSSSSADMSKTC